MLVTSDLAGSVFEQTDLALTFENAWWVERRLQYMKINGLVKMINGSKELSPVYIDGYIPKYKWSCRPEFDRTNIDQCLGVFELVQIIQKPFNWGCWVDLAKIDDYGLFKEALLTAVNFGGNVSYALQVYKSKMIDIENKIVEIQKHLIDESQFKKLDRDLTIESKNQWDVMRNMI